MRPVLRLGDDQLEGEMQENSFIPFTIMPDLLSQGQSESRPRRSWLPDLLLLRVPDSSLETCL